MKTCEVSAAVFRREIGELVDRRGQPRTAGAWAKTRTINRQYVNKRGDTSTRRAIERLLVTGEREIRKQLKAHEISFPSNWGGDGLVHTVDGGQSWHGWRTLEPTIFEDAARRGGWMKAVGELINEHPNWFKAMAKAVAKKPERGIGSPRNKGAYSLSQFFTGDSIARWKTPGRAFRAISHGIRRAKEILSGFEISRVPWKVVANELGASRGPTRGNKLGQRFALQTLATITGVPAKNRAASFGQFKGFRYSEWVQMDPETRKFYHDKMTEQFYCFASIARPQRRVDDGVTLLYNEDPVVVQGHQIVEGMVAHTMKWTSLHRTALVVSPAGRTYHIGWHPSMLHGQPVKVLAGWSDDMNSLEERQSWQPEHIMRVPTGDRNIGKSLTHSVKYWQRFAIRIAQKAWAIQDQKNHQDGMRVPTDCTVLVFVNDSCLAGNCQAGTAAFAEKNGWKKRHFVPIDWLINSPEPRARAAAKVALERYWREKDQRQLCA